MRQLVPAMIVVVVLLTMQVSLPAYERLSAPPQSDSVVGQLVHLATSPHHGSNQAPSTQLHPRPACIPCPNTGTCSGCCWYWNTSYQTCHSTPYYVQVTLYVPNKLADVTLNNTTYANGNVALLPYNFGYHFPLSATAISTGYLMGQWETDAGSIGNLTHTSTWFVPNASGSIKLSLYNSSLWGGDVWPTTGVWYVAANMTIPTSFTPGTGGNFGSVGFWVGIGGNGGNTDLWQAGLTFDYDSRCNNGTGAHFCVNAWYQNPSPSSPNNGYFTGPACSTYACYFPYGLAATGVNHGEFDWNLLYNLNPHKQNYARIIVYVEPGGVAGFARGEAGYFQIWINGKELWGTQYGAGTPINFLNSTQFQYANAGPDTGTAEWIAEYNGPGNSPTVTATMLDPYVANVYGYSDTFFESTIFMVYQDTNNNYVHPTFIYPGPFFSIPGSWYFAMNVISA